MRMSPLPSPRACLTPEEVAVEAEEEKEEEKEEQREVEEVKYRRQWPQAAGERKSWSRWRRSPTTFHLSLTCISAVVIAHGRSTATTRCLTLWDIRGLVRDH